MICMLHVRKSAMVSHGIIINNSDSPWSGSSKAKQCTQREPSQLSGCILVGIHGQQVGVGYVDISICDLLVCGPPQGCCSSPVLHTPSPLPRPSLGRTHHNLSQYHNFDIKLDFRSPVPRHEARRLHRHLLRRCPKDMGSFVEITCSRSVGSFAWCVEIPTFIGRTLKKSHAQPPDMNTRSSKQL